MIELASTASDVVPPAALVLSTIWPDLDAESVSLVGANFQLTLIDGTVREDNFLSEFKTLLIKQQVCQILSFVHSLPL